MGNVNCEGGHSYGLWSIVNNQGVRVCKKCGFERIMPLGDDIVEHVRMQNEAKTYLKAFRLMPSDDDNVLGSIYVLLDDYINYFDDEQLLQFNSKIDECKGSSLIDMKNATLLTSMQLSYMEDFNKFCDLLDDFIEYNQDILRIQIENRHTK